MRLVLHDMEATNVAEYCRRQDGLNVLNTAPIFVYLHKRLRETKTKQLYANAVQNLSSLSKEINDNPYQDKIDSAKGKKSCGSINNQLRSNKDLSISGF